jgi:hypothetical protein
VGTQIDLMGTAIHESVERLRLCLYKEGIELSVGPLEHVEVGRHGRSF